MTDFSLLEPVPTCEESGTTTYHSARNTLARRDVSASQAHEMPMLSPSAKLTNALRLRYYRYEVTFGVYVMTSGEKLVLNSIVMSIIGAMMYGLYAGLRPFLTRVLCRLVYYATGMADAPGTLCAD
jgi:hypothetical protein